MSDARALFPEFNVRVDAQWLYLELGDSPRAFSLTALRDGRIQLKTGRVRDSVRELLEHVRPTTPSTCHDSICTDEGRRWGFRGIL
jgi:hypothetical protein